MEDHQALYTDCHRYAICAQNFPLSPAPSPRKEGKGENLLLKPFPLYGGTLPVWGRGTIIYLALPYHN